MIYAFWSIKYYGKLPQPFHNLPNDVFMDFFNTNWWSSHPGKYEIWKSPYPPLTFLVAFFFVPTDCLSSENSIILRDCSISSIFTFTTFFVISSFLTVKLIFNKLRITCIYKKIILFLVVITSLPFLYTLERGNYIILAYLFFCLYLLFQKKLISFVFFGIAVNFKPYLIILSLPLLFKQEFKGFFKCLFFSGLIFFSTFLFLGDGDIYSFFSSLLNFSSESYAPMQALNYQTTFKIFTTKMTEMSIFPIFSNLANFWLTVGPILFFCYIFINKARFDINELYLALILIIISLSYSFGGYSFIFLFPFMAYFFWRNLIYFLSFLFLLTPIDFPILHLKTLLIENSYFLSGISVQNNLVLTIGGITRPLIVFLLMLSLILNKKGVFNDKSKD